MQCVSVDHMLILITRNETISHFSLWAAPFDKIPTNEKSMTKQSKVLNTLAGRIREEVFDRGGCSVIEGTEC